jgi:NADH-quinone oxidoreductase subunit J
VNVEALSFFLLAGLLVGFSLLVIAVRNPVHSALALVAALFVMAILFLSLSAPMVAALQILVYAGAVMVLFLFVIMLLNPAGVERNTFLWRGIASGACALLMLALIAVLLPAREQAELSQPSSLGAGFGSPEALGQTLFSDFILPFEIASVLLLVAIIGAVVLARRVSE